MEKDNIRRKMKELRERLPVETRTKTCDRITSTCLNLSQVINASCISVYKAFNNEVNTDALIITLLKLNKIIVLPKVATTELTLHRLHSMDDLTQGSFGIWEPNDEKLISSSEVDCFIIPGLAFDRQGYRLGWGRGYYDRLLQQAVAPKIGLAFSQQILPLLPHESYDIVMDVIVTEKETINIVKS